MILAAGSSSRMGTPKQALRLHGGSLLRRTALAALDAGCAPVIVVTGANAEVSRGEIEGLDVVEAFNPAWEMGMGSSVRTGMEALDRVGPDVETAVLLVCDQPHVTADVVLGLIAAHVHAARPLTASAYGGAAGVPAVFSRALFGELRAIEGAAGAREVIRRHAASAHLVPFALGEVDVDTPEDFARVSAEAERGSGAGVRDG
ncbi:NTP transferase domain-containing protein [Longimicrobium terrae]|uniref:Molybdenum cofactor cytidylyltransferase n=1 Tax=Longimicrobium terrae TaxID=1639882 RepID=A0A841H0C7_9BACT|nr:molybdenum cofactor cytidylyltransferase [Longimicrobium terrae]MBB6071399.1 molybdenum cofactor cytidylyltransferase [Longimicrobium terrae]NNC31386.1 nucleotidyltransferase family protein [Longimicrobium terrae]